ncbi:MAG: enoyl-CoA hydratase/isomerase family protein [Geminicoccaceae bacterium]|nr:enoyl-CoA hydratase/isomerase family protein [Geminicoccaceae bacterium]MCB9944397.1 enoyl-CoA hydratase/isomerase family protein [Geminicoccaceae bacterium]
MSALHLLRDGPIAELRLDNPARLNAFTMAMLDALEAHCAAIERDPYIRAVIVTAEGDRAFCAGADIREWSSLSGAEFARHWIRDGHRIFDRLARLCRPTIAAIQGHAFGGGLEFAATCDIRVMAPLATLGLPETGVGIVPGWSGTQRLTRLLPEPVVKEMALFGRRIPAARAHALGFVAEVADDARDVARQMAHRLAATSPRATEAAKYMIHAAVGEDRAAMVETLGGGLVASTADMAEGVAAFKGKRQPVFTGE